MLFGKEKKAARRLHLRHIIGATIAFSAASISMAASASTMDVAPGRDSKQMAAQLNLPVFDCSIKAAKSSGDATTQSRQLRRQKRLYSLYETCVSNYRGSLKKEKHIAEQGLLAASNDTAMKHARARIQLLQHVLDMDMGATEANSKADVQASKRQKQMQSRRFGNLSHGQ